jgi:hypothetical protein
MSLVWWVVISQFAVFFDPGVPPEMIYGVLNRIGARRSQFVYFAEGSPA